MDDATRLKTRISFARVCVEVEAKTNIPDTIKIKLDDGRIVEQAVIAEWSPPKCEACGHFGHLKKDCSFRGNHYWRRKEEQEALVKDKDQEHDKNSDEGSNIGDMLNPDCQVSKGAVLSAELSKELEQVEACNSCSSKEVVNADTPVTRREQDMEVEPAEFPSDPVEVEEREEHSKQNDGLEKEKAKVVLISDIGTSEQLRQDTTIIKDGNINPGHAVSVSDIQLEEQQRHDALSSSSGSKSSGQMVSGPGTTLSQMVEATMLEEGEATTLKGGGNNSKPDGEALVEYNAEWEREREQDREVASKMKHSNHISVGSQRYSRRNTGPKSK